MINFGTLANNDETLPIRITLVTQGGEPLGCANTCVRDLKSMKTLNLNSQNGGQIAVKIFEVKERHSFIEYLQSGLQISLSVALDFTGSNG
jgi:hypothetical protein